MEAPASRWLRVGFAPVVMVVMGVTLSVSTASTANAQRVEWSPGDTPEERISAGLLRTRPARAATAPIAEDLVLPLGVHHEAEAAT